MDLRLPGIILTVTGVLAIVITLTEDRTSACRGGPGSSQGSCCWCSGVLLLTYAIAVPQ